MSTRCNVLLKDECEQLWFYRHSDGYPSCTAESLKKFVGWVNDNRIRKNVSQSGGWLIIVGNVEYAKDGFQSEPGNWKVGAYEPTTDQHGDIEWLYTIDLREKTVTVKQIDYRETVYSFDEFLKTDFIE